MSFEYQFYWKNWYKLWPSYSRHDQNNYQSMGQLLFYPYPIDHFLCIGPLQMRWKTMP